MEEVLVLDQLIVQLWEQVQLLWELVEIHYYNLESSVRLYFEANKSWECCGTVSWCGCHDVLVVVVQLSSWRRAAETDYRAGNRHQSRKHQSRGLRSEQTNPHVVGGDLCRNKLRWRSADALEILSLLHWRSAPMTSGIMRCQLFSIANRFMRTRPSQRRRPDQLFPDQLSPDQRRRSVGDSDHLQGEYSSYRDDSSPAVGPEFACNCTSYDNHTPYWRSLELLNY